MSETAFARQILTTLSSLPIVHASDKTPDSRRHGLAHILPKMPKPFDRSKAGSSARNPTSSSSQPGTPGSSSVAAAAAATGATSGSVQITLRPVRATGSIPVTLPLGALPRASTSVYDVKVVAGQRTGYAPDKIKVLWGKRPVLDSKVLGEVVGAEAAEAELGVMFVGAPSVVPVAGGAAAATATTGSGDGDAEMKVLEEEETPVAQGESGEDVLATEKFWSDLKGFVLQRVRDEEVAGRLVEGFRGSWKGSVS